MPDLKINIVCSGDSWYELHAIMLRDELQRIGYEAMILSTHHEIESADISFFLSYTKIVEKTFLMKSKNNIVVHASDLPKGRGWSPIAWEILNGNNNITFSLIEAVEVVDSGDIYMQEKILLRGDELIDEIRQIQAKVINKMCIQFVKEYPDILYNARPQQGEPSFYRRRKPDDSELNPNNTIIELFNHLRIADNNKYPAYFYFNNHRYNLYIEKV